MLGKMKYNMKAFMSKRMIACDEASFLISYRQDQKLSFKQQMQLNIHLMSCHLCRKYASQIAQLNTAVEKYRDECESGTCHHQLPEDCKAEMKAVVIRELNAK